MAPKPSPNAVLGVLLDRHGETYAHQAGIRLGKGTPSPLYRLLCLATLISARIRAEAAVDATRALGEAGWTTAAKMAGSTWSQRTKVLNRSGYARYDESSSRMLGDTADLLLDRWGGDLRKLREEADREPARERELLKEAKGMGDVGVDVFFREVQGTWDELAPFVDERALSTAKALGLGGSASKVAGIGGPQGAAPPHRGAGSVRPGRRRGRRRGGGPQLLTHR